MNRLHYSKDKINNLDRPKTIQKPGYKPSGFWYSCNNEWIQWVNQEIPEWLSKYRYEHQLDVAGVNLLRLQSVNDILAFNKQYGTRDGQIRWDIVANQYDGIEISPYQWELRLDNRVEWYYMWDIASGCIWNLDKLSVKFNREVDKNIIDSESKYSDDSTNKEGMIRLAMKSYIKRTDI